jgi:hypothetical protein
MATAVFSLYFQLLLNSRFDTPKKKGWQPALSALFELDLSQLISCLAPLRPLVRILT